MLNHQPGGAMEILKLEGELTIFRANELKSLLLGDLRPSVIALSGVTEIDSAGIQLLMLARKLALQSQTGFQLQAPSPEVSEVFELLRLTDLFETPIAGGANES